MPRKKKSESSEEEIKKPKAIGPYDIVRMMFTDMNSFNNLSKLTLERNFFMINRIMSINFPLQAQCFNQLRISESQVIKSWAQFATSKLGYGKIPSFVFTKGAKASSEAKTEIEKELKESYCKHFNISLKDLDDMLSFYHDATIADVENFKKMNDYKEQLKTITKEK